jgi:nitrogen regulatory protein P-II 2
MGSAAQKSYSAPWVGRQPEAGGMKLVMAIIKPSRLDAVLDAVTDAGASGLTVTEVSGFGRQRGRVEVDHGAEYVATLLPKVKLEIAVTSDMADSMVDAIQRTANTGRIGDGKIFVLDLEQALRIRTGERGAAAIAGQL